MIDYCGININKLITINQALQLIKQSITPVDGSEVTVLKKSFGRILASTIVSPINIPPDRNAAMDGYAFSSSDIQKNQPSVFALAGTSWAGKPYEGKIEKNECIRIFTGAVVPDSVDSIIMQEQVQIDNDKNITFPETTITKQNIRNVGGDTKKNAELLPARKKLSAVDIGLLASSGIYDVVVKRKLNIAFFSTGDELCSIGQILKSGQIYDSNRYTLTGLLIDSNFNLSDLGVVTDNKQLIKKKLLNAAKTHDVIITTGGASVGEADYIKEVLDECGEASFWKVAIKPGKPLAFGKISNCYFFGLPGNPVSIITTFQKIVSPALQQLSGMADKKQLSLSAICLSDLKKQKGRQEYQRGILTQESSGELFVESAGKQDSNIMNAMSKANCYIVLPIDSEGVLTGQKVTVEPFDILI